MKKLIYVYGSLLFALFLVVGVTLAAFTDKADVLGASFSVGSADLKLLSNLAGGIDNSNLADQVNGPVFNGIAPNWSGDYLLKVYNNGTSDISLTTNANYETANDPEDLRQVIFVEPFEWDDANNDGILDTGELGVSLGARDTIVKYKTQGYDLGLLEAGNVKEIVLRFSTDSIPESDQGATALFDFEIDSTGI